ncbi:MAG: Tc toxin subunit A [Bacteroidetes bacterium]|nr:Tc toxin subunit A [Bacteroidota bacterium]
MSNPLPTYQNLFGATGYYTVPPDRSVLSPAAYFVQLMQLVQNNITLGEGAVSLQSRRPDLFNSLVLNQVNTENEVSKLSIVNEVVQNYLASLTVPISSSDSSLSAATYPFNLPYDAGLQQTRQYLAQNNTTLQDIWKKLIPEYAGNPVVLPSIQLETLGLSQEQWSQFTTTVAAGNLYLYYGYSSSTTDQIVLTNLAPLDAFSQQTGLSQAQIRELVYQDLSQPEIDNGLQGQFFINQENTSTPIIIAGGQLVNLSTTNLDLIMRFVRLAQAIGWSFADLDWALNTIGVLVNSGVPMINDAALPYLAWIQEQMHTTGLTVNQCCAALGQFKWYGTANGLSFYDQLFNNPANPNNPNDPDWLQWGSYPLLSASQTVSYQQGQIQDALAAALQISKNDLLTIANLLPVLNFIGTTSGLYISVDGGNTWAVVANTTLAAAKISCICETDMAVYVGTTANGLWTSTDGGSTWTQITNNSFPTDCTITCIQYTNNSLNNILYVGTGNLFGSSNCNGLWTLKDGDKTPIQVNEISPSANVLCLLSVGDNLYVGTWDNNIYILNNGGLLHTSSSPASVHSIQNANNTIYACTYRGLFTSNDAGTTWTQLTDLNSKTPFTGFNISCLLFVNGNLFAGTQIQDGGNSKGLWTSPDGGNTWKPVKVNGCTGADSSVILYIENFGNTIYVGTGSNGLWTSVDQGNTWNQVTSISTTANVNSIQNICNAIYVQTDTTVLWTSADNGNTWNQVSSIPTAACVNCIQYIGNALYVGIEYGGVYTCFNGGVTFNKLYGLNVNAIQNFNTTIYACTSRGILTSADEGNTWQSIDNSTLANSNVNFIQFVNDNLYAGTDNGLWISTDEGTTWIQPSNSELSTLRIEQVYETANTVYIGTSNNVFNGPSGVYKLLKGEDTWVNIQNNNVFLPVATINRICEIANTVYVGTDNQGLWTSTDGGNTWIIANSPFTADQTINCIYKTANVAYIGADNGLWFSSDEGTTWIQPNNSNLLTLAINCFFEIANTLFAGTSNGLWTSTDGGNTWNLVSTNAVFQTVDISCIEYFNSAVYVGTNSNGYWISVDKGITWTQVQNSFPTSITTAYCNTICLTPANLSTLYRMSLLPQFTGQTISNALIAADILSQDIGLMNSLQLNAYPLWSMLTITDPSGAQDLAPTQITVITPNAPSAGLGYTFTVFSTSGTSETVVLELNPDGSFSSISIGSGTAITTITQQNVNQYVYINASLTNLLTSTGAIYGSAIFAIAQLQNFFSWLAASPFSLGTLQLITLGESATPRIQNKIAGISTVGNFISDLQAATGKIALTQNLFAQALDKQAMQFVAALCLAPDFPTTFNPESFSFDTKDVKDFFISNIYIGLIPSVIIDGMVVSEDIGETQMCLILQQAMVNALNLAIIQSLPTVQTQPTSITVAALNTFLSSATQSALYNIFNDLVSSCENLLLQYYQLQQKTLVHQLSVLCHTTPAIAQVLKNWADANLEALFAPGSTPLNLLCGLVSPGEQDMVSTVLAELQQGAKLIYTLSLSPTEAAWFMVNNPPTSQYPISFSAVKTIADIKSLIGAFKDSQNNLLTLLTDANTGGNGFKSLAQLTGWNQNDIAFLLGAQVSGVRLLNQYFTIAASLGISIQGLWNLQSQASAVSPGYASVAAALWAGLQAQPANTPATLGAIQNKVNQTLRDKLVSLACYQQSEQLGYSVDALGLYAYLLIDVEVSGVVQTTPVREAISAVQLYVYRCLNQLEAGATCTTSLASLWVWMQSYRLWQANMEVFLYPEDYIEPSLRIDKTDLYTQAESALQQIDFSNPATVENNVATVFNAYMNGLEAIGNLQVVSCAANTYTATGVSENETFQELCMVGRAPTGTGQYYYRLSTFVLSATTNQYGPDDWGQWQKIAVTMNTVEYTPGNYGVPNPIFAFGRWYIFWVEQTTSGGSTSTSTAPGSESTSITTITNTTNYMNLLRFTYLDFNANWVGAQTLISIPSQTPINTLQGTAIQWEFTGQTQLILNVFDIPYIYQPSYFPELYNPAAYLFNCLLSLPLPPPQTGLGMYAGSSAGLYYNTTNGWVPVIPAIINGIPGDANIQCLAYNSGNAFAGTDCGLYVDIGGLWQLADPTGEQIPANANVQCIYASNSQIIYVGTTSGVYYSDNAFNSPGVIKIQLCTGIPPGTGIQRLQSFSGVIYAGTSDGLYSVDVSGVNKSYFIKTVFDSRNNPVVQCVYYSTNNKYIGTANGLYYFFPILFGWFLVGDIPPQTSIQCLQSFRGVIYAGTSNGLFLNTSLGKFSKINSITGNVQCAGPSTGTSLVGTSVGLYYYVPPPFNEWFLVNNIPKDTSIQCIATDSSGNYYVGTSAGLYYSTDGINYNPMPLGVQIVIPPYTAYSAISSNLLIQGAPNWFIVNGQKDQYLNISCPNGDSPTTLNVYRLNSMAIPALGALLNSTDGIDALLTTTAQQTPEPAFSNLGFIATYAGTFTPTSTIDFSNNNAMRMYYWELFFHLPFLIANELTTQQQFQLAKTWLEYIFNPLTTNTGTTNDVYWQFLGLQQVNNATLNTEINEGEIEELLRDLNDPAQVYANDAEPFDPQAIAQLRPIAYQKAIVMNYISNLLAWGDMLYQQNTRSSINEAEMLYVLAWNLLGEQPQDLGNETLLPASVYPNLFGFTCMYFDKTNSFIGTGSGLFYLNSENSWQLVSTTTLQNAAINCLAYDDSSTYYAGTNANGLFSSTDGINWTPESGIPAGTAITCLYFGPAGSTTFQLAGSGKGIYTQTGGTWAPLTTSPAQSTPITCFNYQPGNNYLFAGTSPGVWYYPGTSTAWSQISQDQYNITCITSISGQCYIGTKSNGVFLLSNFTLSQSLGINATATITVLYNDPIDMNFYAGIQNSGLYSIVNITGSSWSAVTSTGVFSTLTINCVLRQTNGYLYSGTNQGLFFMNPASSPANSWQIVSAIPAASIQQMSLDALGNLYVGTSQGLWLLTVANASTNNFELVSFPNQYFGIPQNTQFLSYLGEVTQRIYNIRNGLSLTGQTDNLPLFAPPINPMQLVAAVGSGESLAEAVQSLTAVVPYYRFASMIEKAKEAAATVVQLGQSLFSALQSKDAQKLAGLYLTNQQNLLSLSQAAKQDSLLQAQQTILALQQGLASAQYRQTYYNQLISNKLSAAEISQITLASAAIVAQIPAEELRVAAIVGYLMPTIYGFSDGGFHPGEAINQGASIAEGIGSMLNQGSALAGIAAGFQRRAQDWQLQLQLATDDISQINYQIVAAQYQQDLAQQEITLLQTNIAQQQKVAAFYLSKFTNDQLFSWFTGQLSALYFQAYQLAQQYAMEAQNCWQFEHIGGTGNGTPPNFIQPAGYWNSLYNGLLAGESLQLDLQRMQKAYMDQHVRRFEISKTISLALLDPNALMLLITTGSCTFDIAEADFAWDFPGHFCRRIKTVSISIPMILGPYQNIHATLTQMGSKLVSTDDANGISTVQSLLTSPQGSQTPSLQVNLIPNQQIALSQGVNDTGLFELNFNDPRYLPFEGTGAVSTWQLDIPMDTNFINYASITDVIMQMNYTALPASGSYQQAVTKARGAFSGIQMISLAQAFPDAWYGLVNNASPFQFAVNAKNWRGALVGNSFKISNVWLYTFGTVPGSSLTLTDTTTEQTITLRQSTTNSQMYQWSNLPGESFDITTQNITLHGWPADTTNFQGLTNLVLIVGYSVSNP